MTSALIVKRIGAHRLGVDLLVGRAGPPVGVDDRDAHAISAGRYL